MTDPKIPADATSDEIHQLADELWKRGTTDAELDRVGELRRIADERARR